MKVIKILLGIIIISLVSYFSLGIAVDASSNNIENINLIKEDEMINDVVYREYQMDTSFDSNDEKTTRNVYTYTLKQTEYAHLATWTHSNPDDYAQRNLAAIASDYEYNHPGWIVLGGVNAEGYYNGELTNAFIQDGDVIRKDVSAEAFKKLIGFKDDGSVVIKQVPVATDNPLLKIDNLSFDVTKINNLPEENGISVLTKDLNQTLDLTGYHIIEAKYSMFRKSEEFPNANKTHSGTFLGIFIKGNVIGSREINTIDQTYFDDRRFYVVTKNEEVKNLLVQDKEFKLEFDYIDEFKDVTSMTGYMYRYLIDGEVVPVDYVETNDVGEKIDYNCAYYKSTSKERCGIGFKEDGTIVLLTTNTMRGGPTQYEVGAMFKELGCINAYQFDGGGSVTFLKRNENGYIQMMNTPGDGSPRSILSGLFIVARDPGVQIVKKETTSDKITFAVKNADFMKEATNIKIILNNQEYNAVDGKIVIDNLEENTTYDFDIEYTLNGETCYSTITASTTSYNPGIEVIINTYSFDIKLNQTNDNLLTSKVKVFLNDELTLEIQNNQENNIYSISNLRKDRIYRLSFEYEITNLTTNYKYYRTIENKEYKTLTYEIPILNDFLVEKIYGKLRIKFNYDDNDERISAIKLIVNSETILLDREETRYIIDDYDSSMEYSCQLIIEYLNDLNKNVKIESDIVNIAAQDVPVPDAPIQSNNGCNMGSYVFIMGIISLSILLLRKKNN